jgi:hypothetical protein
VTPEGSRPPEDADSGDPPDDGPFPLRLVLQPEVGSATIEGDTEPACVLRVAERVFLGRDAVVVRDVTSFTSEPDDADEPDYADIADVPWSESNGASTTPGESSC